MSWYNEETDGEYKRYLEWILGKELEPDLEAGFYRLKIYSVCYFCRKEVCICEERSEEA